MNMFDFVNMDESSIIFIGFRQGKLILIITSFIPGVLHQWPSGNFDIVKFRKINNIDNQSFDTDLMKTLHNGHEMDLEGMVNHDIRSLHDVLDKHAPIKTKKCVIKNINHGTQRISEIWLEWEGNM